MAVVRQYVATGPILGLGLTPNALPDLVFTGKQLAPVPQTNNPGAQSGALPADGSWSTQAINTASNLKLSRVPR